MSNINIKKSGSRTLLWSVLMSSPGPLVVGLGLLAGRSSTQIADFVRRSAELLAIIMSFIVYKLTTKDGACDEGPAYWCSAGGSLYNACLVLRDMTDGRWNPFDHPLMRSLSVNPTSMQKGIGNEI